jgi:PAS domain S-box-containing protein
MKTSRAAARGIDAFLRTATVGLERIVSSERVKVAEWGGEQQAPGSNRAGGSNVAVVITLCCGAAAAIGAAGLLGYLLGHRALAAVFPGSRPVSGITGICLIALAVSIARLRSSGSGVMLSKRLAGLVAATMLAEIVVFVAATQPELWLSAEARSLAVGLHPYPATSLVLLGLSLIPLPGKARWRDGIAHVIGTLIIIGCLVTMFGHVFQVLWFVDPRIQFFPVLATSAALALLSLAALLAGPIGWVRILVSRTAAGAIARLVLPATIVVPLATAMTVQGFHSGLMSRAGLTIIVGVNMVFGAALVLGAAAILRRREEAQQHLAAIVRSSADAIYGIGADGTILSWNRGAETIFGYTADEAIGSPASMLEAGGEPDSTIRVRKDGRRIEVELTTSPIHDDQGAVMAVSAIARDITEQSAAARKLSESESRFRRLADSNILGIFFWDASGRIVDANDEFLRITGYSREDASAGSLSWSQMTLPEWEAQDAVKLRELLETGWCAPYEREYVRKDGLLVPVVLGAALYEAESVQGIAFVLDITDRKSAEALQQLRTADLQREVAVQTAALRERAAELETATRKLARSNQELEAFTYSVSHDLRAPLRAMDGFSRILLEESQGKLSATAEEYLHRIRKATERMSQLIDDLLSLSRVSRHSLQVRETSLSAIAAEVADELRASDPRPDVEFVIGENVHAQADPSLLRIALQNLLGNSWKFTSKHPRARIEFGVSEERDGPVYYVRDDGAGFDAKYAAKLFTPFQRLHAASDFDGTGIGLALVERIINRHGGTIQAEGSPEHGATFRFTLQMPSPKEQPC